MVNSNLVPIIVAGIILLQFFFFIKNWLRMRTFRKIFSTAQTWIIKKNITTGFVEGIGGEGNGVFESIKDSINKYLGNNTGSVIDFQLIKDSIDRNCDSVEDEINTQTPVPLYCGLAGTMLGVIIGLGSMLFTNSITTLIVGASDGNIAPAAEGINDLLTGVAWAMVASICGIVFTTINSLMFKGCKREEEKGKNAFLAWLQSCLLPELPNDTSEALTRLVKNLNHFNSVFASNTGQLKATLERVNESYRTQARVIEMVHDMDVMKMANANVNVLKELKECTDKLEQFNEYLDSTEGYTEAIQKFNEQFHKMAGEINVLAEIKAFVVRHKAEIERNVTDEDVALKTALTKLRETSTKHIEELKNTLTDQSEAFRMLNQRMCDEYSQKLRALPNMVSQMEQIAKIPSYLNSLIGSIEQSNNQLINRIDKRITTLASMKTTSGSTSIINNAGIPKWMKLLLSSCAVVITLSVMGIGYFLITNNNSNQSTFVTTQKEVQVVVPDTTKKTDAVTDTIKFQ